MNSTNERGQRSDSGGARVSRTRDSRPQARRQTRPEALLVAGASLLLLLGCGVDPKAAAGAAGLDMAPREVVSPSNAARKTGANQQRKSKPRVDPLRFDGVEGESRDQDHKSYGGKSTQEDRLFTLTSEAEQDIPIEGAGPLAGCGSNGNCGSSTIVLAHDLQPTWEEAWNASLDECWKRVAESVEWCEEERKEAKRACESEGCWYTEGAGATAQPCSVTRCTERIARPDLDKWTDQAFEICHYDPTEDGLELRECFTQWIPQDADEEHFVPGWRCVSRGAPFRWAWRCDWPDTETVI
jgi:hypothetical protein